MSIQMEPASPSRARPDTFDGLMLVEHAHRVANDMAVAIAEIEMCRSRLRDAAASSALTAAADRLRDVCGVQRRLLRPAEGDVDLDTVLADLAGAVVRARSDRHAVCLHLGMNRVRADSRFAWQVATLVAELLTNALKHGVAGSGGQIWLSLEAGGRGLVCTVADDGIGIDDAAAPTSGHGGRIVDAVVEDLGGSVERLTSAAGTTVRLLLPRPVEVAPAGHPRRGDIRHRSGEAGCRSSGPAVPACRARP